MEEIRFIATVVKPQLIVTRKKRPLFKKEYEEENGFLKHYLATEYDTLQVVGDALIYQRLQR